MLFPALSEDRVSVIGCNLAGRDQSLHVAHAVFDGCDIGD